MWCNDMVTVEEQEGLRMVIHKDKQVKDLSICQVEITGYPPNTVGHHIKAEVVSPVLLKML